VRELAHRHSAVPPAAFTDDLVVAIKRFVLPGPIRTSNPTQPPRP